MTSGKPTPSPWEVVALNGFGPYAIRMATPPGTGHPTHYGVGQIGTKANATLIAAAPDLLEAAAAVVAQWDTPNWKLETPTAVLISDLRAAIAKAEGR